MGVHYGRRIRGNDSVIDPYAQNVTLLLNGNSNNAIQNNTFVDSSTNNFTITRTGNVAQGTFSPFSLPEGQWSNYFDGTGDYLTSTASTVSDFGTGNYTFECYVYATKSSVEQAIYDGRPSSNGAYFTVYITTANKIALYVNGANLYLSNFTATTNSWIHIAFVRVGTGTNQTSLYINGVLDGTFTDATNYLNSQQVIGAVAYSPFGAIPFNGYISNLRIVKGNALYTSNFTPNATPLTVVSGTSLLTCQSNRFKDNSSNNFNIAAAGDSRVTAFSPFAPYDAYGASVNGGSAYFDGNGDYLDSPANNNFIITGEFTVECWYYQNAVATYPTVFELGQYTNGILFRPVNTTNGTLWINNVQRYTALSTPLNGWVHVAITRDTSNLVSFYINGQRLYSGTITGTINSTGGLIRVGTSVHTTGQHHNGYITDFRFVNGSKIYDPTLTTITVPTQPLTAVPNTKYLIRCTNAGIIDSVAKNNLETVGDAKISTSVVKYGNASMYFDGTGDYLVIPSSQNTTFGTGDFTIECWFYIAGNSSQNTSGNRFAQLLGGVTPSNTGLELNIAGNSTTTGTGIEFINTVSGTQYKIVYTGTVSQATWHYVAVVRNGTTTTIYFNGTSVASGTLGNQNISSTNNLFVGALNVTNFLHYLNGYIDDLRITKGVARYTANFIPPNKQLSIFN